MIPYYIIFSPIILAAILSFDKKINKMLGKTFALLFVILILFGGLQYGINDYVSYELMYEEYSFDLMNFPFYESIWGGTGHEFLYITLSLIFKWVGFTFPVFFFVVFLLTAGIKLFLIKKYSPYLYVSMLIYIALIYIKDMTQLRAQIATSIIFLLIPFIIKGKPIHYVFGVLIASLFHIMALTALPLFWVARLKHVKALFIALMLFSVFLSLKFTGITKATDIILSNFSSHSYLGYVYDFETRYVNNPTREFDEPLNISFGIAFYILLATYAFANYNKLTAQTKILLTYLVYGTCGFLLFRDLRLFSYRFIEMYCHFSLALLLPMIMAISSYERKIAIWAVSILYGVFFTYTTLWKCDLPEYDNIIFPLNSDTN